MSKHPSLSDDQWNRLLDTMANKQPTPPVLHAHASDIGYGDFSTENLNHTANDPLSHSANCTFAAPRVPEVRDIDDHSLADLRILFKELETVKQRYETRRNPRSVTDLDNSLDMRSRQVDKLLKNMQNVFAHLAEMEPFLQETRTMLKEVVARVGDWDAASPTLEETSRNENGEPGIEAFVDAGPVSAWMGAAS